MTIIMTTIPTLFIVLGLSLFLVHGFAPSHHAARPNNDGRIQTARYDHQSSNNNNIDVDVDLIAPPPITPTTTGDVLLDRRLAMVRTVALAASGTATAATLTTLSSTYSSSSPPSSSSLFQPPPPANAVGRAEILINTIQSKPEIVAARNTQGDPTKHTPLVTMEKDAKGYGQILTVQVPHVMDFDKPHYIQYLWLQDVTTNPNDVRLGNIIAAQAYAPSLKIGGKTSVKKVPVTVARLSTKVASGRLPTKAAYLTKGMIVKPCLYCNLHGLWEGDPISLG